MRLLLVFFVLQLSLLLNKPLHAVEVELTNATLIAKLHLDSNPRSGQMVGAYVASIKAPTGKSISTVTVLLNPGLQFVKAEAGRQRLNATDKLVMVDGKSDLEVRAVEINLGRTLSANDSGNAKGRMDVAIHYRGYVEDISWMGMSGVKDTLSPRFTMLRPESFSYPVFAAANWQDIEQAFNHGAFYQGATIDYPGSNTLVSNLKVDSKAINGTMTRAELSTDSPAKLMTVAIGPYQHLKQGSLVVEYLGGLNAGARNTANVFSSLITKTNSKLGPIGGHVKIIQLAEGFETKFERETLFVTSDFLKSPRINPAMSAALAGKWLLSKGGRSDHWAVGLDRAISLYAFSSGEQAASESALFSRVKDAFAAHKKLGKTALPDYIIEGYGGYAADVSNLGFSVLHSLLGEEEFFALVRSVRVSLGSGYADMEALADHLQKNIKNKKAKKFAKSWFSSNKAAKDMAKAQDFATLTKRYK